MTRNITPCAVFTPAPVRRFWRRHSAHSRHPVRLVPKRCAKRTSVHSARCIFWACACRSRFLARRKARRHTPARRLFCRSTRCRCGWKRCAYMRRRPCPLRSRRKKRSVARLKICISCKSLRLEKTGVCLRKTSHIRQKTARFTSRPGAYVLKISRRRRRSPCLKSLKIRRI